MTFRLCQQLIYFHDITPHILRDIKARHNLFDIMQTAVMMVVIGMMIMALIMVMNLMSPWIMVLFFVVVMMAFMIVVMVMVVTMLIFIFTFFRTIDQNRHMSSGDSTFHGLFSYILYPRQSQRIEPANKCLGIRQKFCQSSAKHITCCTH